MRRVGRKDSGKEKVPDGKVRHLEMGVPHVYDRPFSWTGGTGAALVEARREEVGV